MDIQAAKKRCEAASKGPWYWSDGALTVEDAEFIMHARSDLPAALEALEEAQGERDVARERAYVLAESLHRYHSDAPPPCDRCSPTMRWAILGESE